MMSEQELLEYACGQFEQGVYDVALGAFILAYAKGYEKEWILENIYNCYMAGNEAEFQRTYETWKSYAGIHTSYEDCLLDFIPYREGEYYIYDKEIKGFRGIFSMSSVYNVTRQADIQQLEFSALSVEMYWDWRNLPGILTEAGYHKIYAVCQDMNRCASFFKVPELAGYAENIMLFSGMEEFQCYFHEHTAVYLPKICIGEEDGKNELIEIINQEHEYRLTPEGRNTDNVLLTIGIPTYERGNLILKRLENLGQMPYDAEIEFAISKNGTTLYQEEYNSIESIPDARIHYIGYDKTLTAWDNTKNVMRMASGKFVLIVSDEDDVLIPALEHYLHVLCTYDNLGMVRARTRVQYAHLNETAFCKKGKNALFGGFLLQNYMSGAIYHKEKFWESGIEEWDKKYFWDNSFYGYYPHMWCQLLLSRMGDYLQDSVCLISEGESAYGDMKEQYQIKGNLLADNYQWEREIPVYSKWESRLEQFRDALVVFRDFAGEDTELEMKMTEEMIDKTVWLMSVVKEKYMIEERLEKTREFLDEVRLVMDRLGLELTEDKKKFIVSYLI